MAPRAGNGGRTERYVWTQTLQEVSVVFDKLPAALSKRDVECHITRQSISLKVKGEVLSHGELYALVHPGECFWQLDSHERTITINLEKVAHDEWWKCVVKGDPEIDTGLVEPENARLQDLDDETRTVVEKMMVEQRQQQMTRAFPSRP
ncbi:Protein BOBBER 1 [Porphyridium purpureum]|uniref:Protein BOBBER 1 n=1 Tax=Porphyridium purpureum TaxID=35688 RepID=A0A5J4Z2A7_PORPP|nr:Protein BOBBER 1 [Porphyridium purpureum]|eukprot:POR7769..scf295_1